MILPVRYSLRSLAQRRISVALTAVGISLVVGLFVAMGAFAAGLAATFQESGSDRNVIVTRRGTLAEPMSAVPREAFAVLRDFPEVAMADRRSLASPEVVVLWVAPLKEGGELSVAMRGVTEQAYLVRPRVRVVAGRRPAAGSDEAMVGTGLAGKVAGFEVGGSFRFGRRTWRVVGIFDDQGGPTASEVWADVNGVMDDDRREVYSSALLPVKAGADPAALIARVEADRRFALRAQLESAYFKSQAGSAEPMQAITAIVAVIMGIGAIFGALNTMYASLASRTREVATLRALGFPKDAIASAFILESLLVALPAGVLGCLLASPVTTQSVATLNLWTFSAVAFQPRLTPGVLAGGMMFAALIGILGGLWPARSAANVPLAVQLRR